MKKTAIRLSFTAFTAIFLSGCSFTSDALFPSLFGSDAQEEMISNGDFKATGAALPELGSTNKNQFVPIMKNCKKFAVLLSIMLCSTTKPSVPLRPSCK